MSFTARIDVSPVATYYGQLAVMLKQDLPRTIRFEASATVRRAMSMVKSSNVSEVRARAMRKGVARFEGGGKIEGSTNVSKRRGKFGQQWLINMGTARVMPMSIWGGTLVPMAAHTGQGWRTSDEQWGLFKRAWDSNLKDVKLDMKAKVAARGITAKSWYDLLIKLNSGQTDGIAAFVTRARPISGRNRPVVFVGGTGAGTSQYTLTVTNTSGVAIATNGARKLASSITIRREFFRRNMEQGFFFDAKFVAKNYPWVKVG